MTNINIVVAAQVQDAVSGLNQVNQATRRVGDQVGKATSKLKSHSSAYNSTAVATNKWAKGALQQAGYQVGDFAVQVGNGTSAMQAFGQQGSQLLGVFGPIGAVLGAGVAIFSAIAVAFEKTAAAAKEMVGEVRPLSSSISAYRTAVDNAAMSTDELKDRFGDAATAAAKLFNVKAQIAQIEAVESLVEAGKQLQTVFGVEGISTVGLKKYAAESRIIIKSIENFEAVQRSLLESGTDSSIESATEYGRLINSLKFELQDLNRENAESAKYVANIAGSFGLLDSEALDFAETLTSIIDAAKTGVGENMVAAIDSARQKFDELVDSNKNLSPVQRAVLKSLLDQQLATFELVKTTDDFQHKAKGVLTVIRDTSAAARKLATNLSLAFSQLSDTSKLDVINAQINAIKSGYSQMEVSVAAFRKQKEIELGLSEAANDAERAYISAVINRSTEQYRATLRAQNELDELSSKFNTNTNSVRELTRAVSTELSPAMKRAKEVGDIFGKSVENAMISAVDGTKSVKEAFKSMAAEIIKELYRIFVVKKATAFISDAVGLFTGKPVGQIDFMAKGGPVSGRSPYIVGEKGPELFVPNSSGTIIPNNRLGSGGGGTIVVNQTINVSTGVQQTVRTEIKSLMPQIAESAKAAVADAKRRGGSYGRAFA